MAAFLDVCRFNPTAGGTADWTFSSVVPGYQSPASATAVNGRLYKYRAETADLSQWELGEGAYNTGTGVLARATVLFNSSGTTSKINFSTVPQVAVVALKEDLISIEEVNAFTATQRAQARLNISAVLRGQLFGLGLTYVGTTTFNVAAGEAADSTGVDLLVLTSAISKTTGSWAVGSGNGSLDVGSIAAGTHYHVHEIKRSDTGVVDVLSSLAPGTALVGVTMVTGTPGNITWAKHGLQANTPVAFTTTGALLTGLTAGTQYYVKTVVDADTFTVSATQGGSAINLSGTQSGVHTATANPILPSNYTLFRRIGALKTNASLQWRVFTQYGDYVNFALTSNDFATASPATSLTTIVATSCPPGVPIVARMRGLYNNSGAGNSLLICSVDETEGLDGNLSGRNRTVEIASAGLAVSFTCDIALNTASQFKYHSNAGGTTLDIEIYGYVDRRGRDA